jgi:hypothetical protein
MNIADSGDRTEFGTGAVRDAQTGKGRMDLLPMRALRRISDEMYPLCKIIYSFDVAYHHGITSIYKFMEQPANKRLSLIHGCYFMLWALEYASEKHIRKPPANGAAALPPNALILIAKVFEAGADKYDERNWELGIPVYRFIDSGLRHAAKYVRGNTEEPHLAQACWNFLCCLDTLIRIDEGLLPETLNTLPIYPQYVDQANQPERDEA